MSYWNNHPEVLDEIITNALPEPWLTLVGLGEIKLSDVPDEIFFKAAVEGEADYWGGKADEAKERRITSN